MGLPRTVSQINGDIRRKSPIFPTTRVFNAPAEGVPLGIVYRRRCPKKLEWWGFQTSKMFSDRFSRFDTIPACDGHPASQPASQPRCRSKDAVYYVARVKSTHTHKMPTTFAYFINYTSAKTVIFIHAHTHGSFCVTRDQHQKSTVFISLYCHQHYSG